MRSNLQIYTVHELDFRCRQTEEHASVQTIHSFYKLCSPYFRDDLRRGRKANSVVSSMAQWHAQWSGYGQASLQCKLLLFAVNSVNNFAPCGGHRGNLNTPSRSAPRRSATSGTYPLRIGRYTCGAVARRGVPSEPPPAKGGFASRRPDGRPRSLGLA